MQRSWRRMARPRWFLRVAAGPGQRAAAAGGQCTPELLGAASCGCPPRYPEYGPASISALFEPGQATLLYGPVQWSSCLRTVLEPMESPGASRIIRVCFCLGPCSTMQSRSTGPRATPPAPQRDSGADLRLPCRHYQQKLSLSEAAAKFYISPYYLSRLFRAGNGQSIVDYINGRRIEAAQKLLETTELSIGTVAEQTALPAPPISGVSSGRPWALGRCNTGRAIDEANSLAPLRHR